MGPCPALGLSALSSQLLASASRGPVTLAAEAGRESQPPARSRVRSVTGDLNAAAGGWVWRPGLWVNATGKKL